MKHKDRLVEEPATAFWYEWIREHLGEEHPYAVEKQVEPDTFRQRRGSYSHNNKWARYKAGKHVPQKRLRAMAECVCPGATAVLDLPIWKIASLRTDEHIAEYSNDWLRQLGAEMQPLFFRIDPATGHEVRRGVSTRKLRLLRQRADIAALSALSILLRESTENCSYKLSMEIGDALFRTLLQCAVSGGQALRIVLPKIFLMLTERVFPFAHDRHYRICLDGLDFEVFCTFLQRAVNERRIDRRLPPKPVSIDDLDSVIFGWCRTETVPWLVFCLPQRPIDPHGKFSEGEDNFQAFMKMWREAADVVHGTPVLEAAPSEKMKTI